MSVADDNGLMNETIDKNSLKIPLGDGNARFIDGKNQLKQLEMKTLTGMGEFK